MKYLIKSIILFGLSIVILGYLAAGMALNHKQQLNLEQRYLSWPWLLQHYGMATVKADAVYLLEDKVFSQFGSQLFINDKPVAHVQEGVVGGIVMDDLTVLATDRSLLLFTPQGEFVEKMDVNAGVPQLIQNIGIYHGEPILQTRQGMWRTSFLLDQWELVSLQGVSWSSPYPMPDDVHNGLKHYFYGEGVSLEQFLLDVHNGHILGDYGVWLLDVLAILLIILSFSGLWIWGQRLH